MDFITNVDSIFFMNANFQLVYLSDASRPGLPGQSSYVETGKPKPWKSCSSAARKIITFCGEDLRGWTGPVRLGSLTHDFEAAPKKNRL